MMKTVFDFIIRFIWALTTVGFVGILIYLRKSLKSLLVTLANVESMKWGKRGELKIRQQMDKFIEASKPKAETISEIETKSGEKEDYKKQMHAESAILGFCNLLLLLHKFPNIRLNSEQIEDYIKARDLAYHNLRSINPSAQMITLTDTSVLLPPVEEPQQSKP